MGKAAQRRSSRPWGRPLQRTRARVERDHDVVQAPLRGRVLGNPATDSHGVLSGLPDAYPRGDVDYIPIGVSGVQPRPSGSWPALMRPATSS